MKNKSGPLETENNFFQALLAGIPEALDDILKDDFILIDVMSGSEITKTAFVDVLNTGLLKFTSIVPKENHVRLYGSAAIITGQTEMKGLYGETAFTVKSRYTHVFIEENEYWRMASAQGTVISE